jgi:hypothetical protein
MDIGGLIDTLGYKDSTNFLSIDRLDHATEHAHIFRRAVRTCRLHGVYVLHEHDQASHHTSTPIVYVASAESKHDADLIHKRVWNQNVVPFLLVRTPECVRLYSGFWYQRASRDRYSDDEQRGVLEAAVRFSEVATRLRSFHARSIDNGTLWGERGSDVSPTKRVDWRLLDNLKQLADWLRSRKLEPRTAHALIGKFIYLRYLRDRDILSERRLADWGISHDNVFGRGATLAAVRQVVQHVDTWLNGSIFPLPFSGNGAPKDEHLQKVTSVFLGDEVESGQMHLEFSDYDFSHIPIETLSIIYEQFLAIEGKNRSTGAYYTPLTLVNFILAELDDTLPLQSGMRVLDPSCGSGAFLVQCYRRLVERQLHNNQGRRLRPTELRDLLVRHIFGLDRDIDACRIAELSLVLTMLDYIDPPDLQSTPTFKLPDLHNRNIFESDFFDPESTWECDNKGQSYQWVVGNPPWLRLSSGSLMAADRPAYNWINRHARTNPVVNNDVAEAFAWKSSTHLAENGVAGLLLPAMTLFREAITFRAQFFTQLKVATVANFANLREVLFAGRARMPAVALFYSRRPMSTNIGDESTDASVLVYSPMVANQAANQPSEPGRRMETWNITLDHSEVRALRERDLQTGENLHWKLAMWGSKRDERLLLSLNKRHATLDKFTKGRKWIVSQGLELRHRNAREPIEPLPAVVDEFELDVEALRRLGRIHSFPPTALNRVHSECGYVRAGRRGPLAVCFGPHVIVSAARTFAVFHDAFLVVPHPQLGISGPKEDADFLRALALFLNSDFATYHQFLTSPQEGVHDGRGTLRALRKLPVPLNDLAPATIRQLNELHAAFASMTRHIWSTTSAVDGEPERESLGLNLELNRIFDKLLGLETTEQCLIHDLVHVRMHLRDGQFGAGAVRRPEVKELRAYAEMLCAELDTFLDETLGLSHRVLVVFDQGSGMVQIEVGPRCHPSAAVHVLPAEAAATREFQRVRVHLERKAGQWLYFDRNLLIHIDGKSFFLKPLQILWWTRTQALLDADEIITEYLAPEASA